MSKIESPVPLQGSIRGEVKWYDPVRGFGFLQGPDGGGDILLHGNVLRNFGQSSVAERAYVEALILVTPRGRQVSEILSIRAPDCGDEPPINDLADFANALDSLEFMPARVKWFDIAKGFGFANVFGASHDVFIHIEVLRHCGFADLAPGEAVALKVVDGPRGKMAAAIAAWDHVEGASDGEISGEAGEAGGRLARVVPI